MAAHRPETTEGPPAAEALLREHRGRLRALAQSLLRDPAAVDDVLQDAWVVASRHPPARTDNVPGWLRTVVRHLALRRLRGESRRRARERVAAHPERLPSAAEMTGRLELERRLIDAVDALEEPYRHTIVLRFFEGLMPRQIAAAEGIPVNTVKTRLSRGVARLRLALDRRHGDRRAWALPLAGSFSLRTAVAPTSITTSATVGALLMAKHMLAILLLVALGAWFAVNMGDGADDTLPTPEPSARTEEPIATLEGAAPGDEPLPVPEDAGLASRLGPDDKIPPTTFAGRVVDASGAGIAGAGVEAFYYTAVVGPKESANGIHLLLRRERERFERPSTRTDAGGYFHIDRPWRARAFLKTTAAGFAPAVTLETATGEFVRIALSAEGSLRVRVTDPDDRRVRDAEVRLLGPGVRAGTFPSHARRVLAKASTDASGIASLPLLQQTLEEAQGEHPRGTWFKFQLEVVPDDPALGVATGAVGLDQSEVEIQVPRVKTVTHRVVDARTGLPIPDAYVDVTKTFRHLSFENESWRRRIHADQRGVVRIPQQKGYGAGNASAPGYMIANVWDDPIRLVRGMRITGTVLDEAGAPVADVPIYVVLSGGVFDRAYAGLPLVSAWSGRDGRFALETKLPGPAHGNGVPDLGVRTLVAVHPRHAPAVIDDIAVEPGTSRDVVLRFPPGASIELSIVDVEGAPVTDQWVAIARLIPRAATWAAEKDYGLDITGLARDGLYRTDADGRLTIAGLPPGTHRVRAENLETLVELRGGETKTVKLVKGAGPSITCVVVDADGSPIADAYVSLGGPMATVKRTDAEGRVRFDDLVPGEYSVGTAHPRFGFGVSAKARPSDHEVLLEIPAGPAKLEIRVTGLPDDVPAAYSLMTRTGGSAPKGTGFAPMTAHTGLTPGFTPGKGVLLVRAAGHGWVLTRFEAPAEETTRVEVAMHPAGRITGQIEGDLVPGSYVVLKRQDPPAVPKGLEYALRRSLGSVNPYTKVDAERRFDAADIVPGRYVAEYGKWSKGGGWHVRAHSLPIEVVSGKTAEVVLRP